MSSPYRSDGGYVESWTILLYQCDIYIILVVQYSRGLLLFAVSVHTAVELVAC